jgi:hypothetical protein
MGTEPKLPTWWKTAVGLLIAYACLLFYIGAVVLVGDWVVSRNVLISRNQLINLALILFLPSLLFGFRKPVAASVLLFVLAAVYFVLACAPPEPDPFGPAVQDRVKDICDFTVLLVLPAIAAGLLLRWKARRPIA